MADLYFYRQLGILAWPSQGSYWSAVSGIQGSANLLPLPSGVYTIGRREVTDYTPSIGSAFQDKTGNGFFIPIFPTFATNRGRSGGRLGIHPDGNVPGTAGCIGLTDPDTSSFFNAIAGTAAAAQLTLEVY